VRVVTAQPQAPKHLTHTDRMLAHERAAPLRPLAEATDLMILSPPRPLAGEGAGG